MEKMLTRLGNRFPFLRKEPKDLISQPIDPLQSLHAELLAISPDSDIDRVRIAELIDSCILNIHEKWEEVQSGRGLKLIEHEASLSPTLAIRHIIKLLRNTDYLGEYGLLIGSDIFKIVVHHHQVFAEMSYIRAANPFIGGIGILSDIFKSALVVEMSSASEGKKFLAKMQQSLSSFLNKQTIAYLEDEPLAFLSEVAWLFLSSGDQLTSMDLELIAMYFDVHTSMRNLTPARLEEEEYKPLASLGKTLVREGRKPTSKEITSVSNIVQKITY
jgi:hypothetical protein